MIIINLHKHFTLLNTCHQSTFHKYICQSEKDSPFSKLETKTTNTRAIPKARQTRFELNEWKALIMILYTTNKQDHINICIQYKDLLNNRKVEATNDITKLFNHFCLTTTPCMLGHTCLGLGHTCFQVEKDLVWHHKGMASTKM